MKPSSSVALYRLGSKFASALPYRLVLEAGAVGGIASWALSRQKRLVVRSNLRRVLGGEVSVADLERTVIGAFAGYGRYWADSLRIGSVTRAQLETYFSEKGMEHLVSAMAEGRGVIMVLPHLGGWEFGGAWLAQQGFPMTVVAEQLEPKELFDWFRELREGIGIKVVPLGLAAGAAVLRTLRKGGLVGLLADRDVLGSGTEVELFGAKTTLPSGAATLALKTGAALLPAAVYLNSNGTHVGVIRPPVSFEKSGDLKADSEALTQILAGELEALIRKDPSQWHMFQPGWPS